MVRGWFDSRLRAVIRKIGLVHVFGDLSFGRIFLARHKRHCPFWASSFGVLYIYSNRGPLPGDEAALNVGISTLRRSNCAPCVEGSEKALRGTGSAYTMIA